VSIKEHLPTLVTERVPLETVLRNLLNNAIKHHNSPQAGRIEINAHEQENYVEFRVTDNGPGIDPQYHEQIFGLFQTIKSRDVVEGSGMGLAIVKRTIESRGGMIGVESRLGDGATFRFTWPKDGVNVVQDALDRENI
jgi:signal transduction histidine kinase